MAWAGVLFEVVEGNRVGGGGGPVGCSRTAIQQHCMHERYSYGIASRAHPKYTILGSRLQGKASAYEASLFALWAAMARMPVAMVRTNACSRDVGSVNRTTSSHVETQDQ